MTNRPNSEVFNEAVARILAHMWEQHPIAHRYDFQGLKKALPGVPNEEYPIYSATFNWLVQEGFIVREERQQTELGRTETFLGKSTLSLRGMALLGQALPGTPGSSAAKPLTVGQHLLESVKSGAIDVSITIGKEIVLAAAREWLGLK